MTFTYRNLRIAHFANILLFALVMGVFWGTWFSLSRSIGSIRAETFLEIGHTMIDNLGRPMSILMPAALISSVLLIIVLVGWPSSVYLFQRFRRAPMPMYQQVLVPLCFLAAIVLSVATFWMGMRTGVRALEEMDRTPS